MRCVSRPQTAAPDWRATRMINYTERITLLIDDLVKRVPGLRYIDPSSLLVFAR